MEGGQRGKIVNPRYGNPCMEAVKVAWHVQGSHGKRKARPSSCLPCHCHPNRISRGYEVRPIYRRLFTAR